MTVAEHPPTTAPTSSEGIPPSSRATMDEAASTLHHHRQEWAELPIPQRIALLDRLTEGFTRIAESWVRASREAEGIEGVAAFGGEEWLAGPYFVLRNIRLLRRSLRDVERKGFPRLPAPAHELPDGRVAAPVFPTDLADRLFFPGVTAEVWMQEGVTLESLPETQATAYREHPRRGGVVLVLGAGNVSSIGPMDALYKMFAEDKVVLYKMHPVNAYLGPLLEQAFAPLLEAGFLRIVYGGAEEGSYLCHHEQVDEIHMTGSDRTFDAIVFGPGEEGRKRKRERKPVLGKRITAELGNVSPVIVVPGPWSRGDLAYQAENLVSMLTNNAGFNCNATRVVIQHEGWELRPALLDEMRRVLADVPTRRAYYPGAADRFEQLVAAHPGAERFGERTASDLPWTFIPDLDAGKADDLCFRMEAFCSLFGETALAAASPAEFIEKAVRFANDTLWGTLNVTLLVHPESLKDPATNAAYEQALRDLRYGTVAINHWAAIGYGLVSTTWGAFPGHDLYDVQSGIDVVHNTYLFSRPEKSVVRSPFRVWPKPPWFITHGAARPLTRKLTLFEADRSPVRLPGIFLSALRG